FEYDAESRVLTAQLPEDGYRWALHHTNVFGHRNHPRVFGSPRMSSPAVPVNRQTYQTEIMRDPAEPWTERRTVKTPIVLLDGGATSESQAVLDAIDMPEGSAMTIAKIDVDGLRAIRWRDTGDDGFYPASTVKLATALMTLRQVNDLEPELPFQAWLVSLDDSEPKPVAELLTAMIKESDNDDFNTLQEVAGFAETRDFLKGIGCESLLIRRHFTRPHWNHSRPARFVSGEAVVDVDARPAPDMPLNAAGGESNWSSTDDLVRLAAATFLTDARDLDGFGVLTDAMAETNEPFVGRGLDRLGNFKQYNKPGWWPGDGSFCDVAYVFDRETNLHYLVGIYWQGEPGEGDEEELDPAREGIADAIEQAFAAIRDGRIRL
ncbi:MAG: serine hydrolase, partial [Planctomycetota bacterium]